MRAALFRVVLAAVTASAGMAFAQGVPAPGPPIEPQMTGSPASQPAPSQPSAVQPQASQPQASQPPVSQPPVAQRSAPPRTGPARIVPPGVVNPRRPRTFAQCNQEALRRGMRGAERRHWIQRCELGYGRPLFRRRGSSATQSPGGGELPGSGDAAPLGQDRGETGAP